MRVVVTRPQPSAARTAAALRALGHVAMEMPLMRAHHDLSAFSQKLPSNAAAIVVTSAEALRALARTPPEARSAYLRLPLFAVGARTAEAARSLGFSSVACGNGEGQSLAAELLNALPPSTDAPVVYLAGTPRTPGLEEAIALAQRPIDLRLCYRMQPEDPDPAVLRALALDPPDAVLLYSPQSARRFDEIAAQDPATWSGARFFCLSMRIASALPEEKRSRAVWPMEPQEDFLLQMLDSQKR